MGLLQNAEQGQPMVPQMAEAAAAAGAPAPGAAAKGGQPPPGGAPAPGGAPPAGAAPGGAPPAGAAPGGAPPGGAPAPGGQPPAGAAPPEPPVRKVDPGQAAVPGELPANMTDEKASPEEQKEYERAMQALAQILYSNEKTSNAIVDQINPEDKVSSTAKVSILLMKQLDSKIQLDEGVVAEVTREATARIMELAEARHGLEYGGREEQVILGSVWEGIQSVFGMDQDDAAILMQGIGGDNLAQMKETYEGMLNG